MKYFMKPVCLDIKKLYCILCVINWLLCIPIYGKWFVNLSLSKCLMSPNLFVIWLFSPGSCRGPVYPGFQYNSEVGTRAAPIKVLPENCRYPEVTIPVYCNGGGFFDFLPPDQMCSDPSVQVKILAHYDDVKDQPIAIVRTQFGSGQTLLTGVHVEFDPYKLDSENQILRTFIGELKQYNDNRIELLKKLLQHINLSTKSWQ